MNVSVSAGIAAALLAGDWEFEPMRRRAQRSLRMDRTPRWLRTLVTQVLELYPRRPADRPRELAAVIRRLAQPLDFTPPTRVARWYRPATEMAPSPWPVSPLATVESLMRLLDLDAGELAWFADVRNLERTVAEPLRHYRWRELPKRNGVRLVAAPKPRLKEIQRRLLRHVLRPIPVHEAAHGGVPGRSVRTALLRHAGAATVIRADLQHFFAAVPGRRVYALLRHAGYPESVAFLLTGLCTAVPPREFSTVPSRPQLPQGAPTSTALADVVSFTLDRRLTGLAASFDARYTRYVDDLTFSGGPRLARFHRTFLDQVEQIVQDEGHRLVAAKSVVLPASGRQQALGAVLNDRPTLTRPERDNLRAILHNCARHGWRSQTRDRPDFPSWLRGRISYVAGLDPVFGRVLLDSYEAIDWS